MPTAPGYNSSAIMGAIQGMPGQASAIGAGATPSFNPVGVASPYTPVAGNYTPGAVSFQGIPTDQGAGYLPSGNYQQNAYQAQDVPSSLPQYDLMRNNINSQYSTVQGQAQDSLDRQFAAMGGGPGNGAQAKQTENLATSVANQKGQDLNNINFQEAQQIGQMKAVQQQEAYQSGETQKGYGFQAGQAAQGMQFQGSQNAMQRALAAATANSQGNLQAQEFGSGQGLQAQEFGAGQQLQAQEFGASQGLQAGEFNAGQSLQAQEFGQQEGQQQAEFGVTSQLQLGSLDQAYTQQQSDLQATAFNAAIAAKNNGESGNINYLMNKYLVGQNQAGLGGPGVGYFGGPQG